MSIWQEEYLKELESASNDELFKMFWEAQMPDDWDGCFTQKAGWKRDKSEVALVKRLKEHGFLSKEFYL